LSAPIPNAAHPVIADAIRDYPDAPKLRSHFEKILTVWPGHYREHDAGFRDFAADIRACIKAQPREVAL